MGLLCAEGGGREFERNLRPASLEILSSLLSVTIVESATSRFRNPAHDLLTAVEYATKLRNPNIRRQALNDSQGMYFHDLADKQHASFI